MRRRVLAYLEYIDMILKHELPVTASFDAKGEYVRKAAKDEAPTRKDYEKLLETHLHYLLCLKKTYSANKRVYGSDTLWQSRLKPYLVYDSMQL